MTLPASGEITMYAINGEFGRGTDLYSYHGVQWWTDSGSTGNFSSGQITMQDFYGKRATSPIFYVNVSGPDVNLYWYCVARGWNKSSAVVATTVGDIYGSSTSSWAMIIDAMPSSVTLFNNNYIAGHGGAGGAGAGTNVISRTPAPPNYEYTGENGENGGHALYVSASNHGVTIYNAGVIGGGGGGGGGGGYMETYNVQEDYYNEYAGGGGGGGAWFGTGGSGGIAAYNGGVSADGDPGGTAGYAGTFGGAGAGGQGGNGGYLGQSGNNGYASASTIGYYFGPGYGAGSGWAVYGTNRISWGAYGTVLGPVGNS